MKFFKLLTLALVALFYSCNSDDDNGGGANNPPASFDLITVADNAIGVDRQPTLSWEAAADPGGYAVVYDIYISEGQNPETVLAADVPGTQYQVTQRLSLVTQYSWRVVAKNSQGASTPSAEKFSFTTRNLNSGQNAGATGLPEIWGHGAVSFNGQLFTLGGANLIESYKSNTGQAWSTIAGNMSQRRYHGSTVFNNKMWMIGGLGGMNLLHSSVDGTVWIEETANAGFSRYGHTSVTFNNKLYVIGGDGDDGTGWKNDVWSSSNGVNWTQVTADAGFAGRNFHASVVFDNKIWVVGGSSHTVYNDVWFSSDGVSWTQASGNAGFTGRDFHSLTVYDGKMWLIGGRNGNNDYLNDIWFSEDGVIWAQLTGNANFSPRSSHTVTEHDGKLVLIGGVNNQIVNDVWFLD